MVPGIEYLNLLPPLTLAPIGSPATATVETAETSTATGKRKRVVHSNVVEQDRQVSGNTLIADCVVISDEDSLLDDEDHTSSCNGDGEGEDEGKVVQADASWEANFQLLVQHKNKHGTTTGHKRNSSLGNWVIRQRTLYRKKMLTNNCYQRLDSIGLEWNTTVPWFEMYNLLRSYKSEHNGSVCVPMRSNARYKGLGAWVMKQRRKYSSGKLSEARIYLLESIGFEWRVVRAPRWMEMFGRLVEFKKKHGHTRLCKFYNEDPQLLKWVYAQRRFCEDKKRIDILNSIGFEWRTK